MPAYCAANFNGNNYLSVANYTGNPAAMSVSCWVQLNITQGSRVFFGDFLPGGTNKGWVVGISDSTSNKIKFYLGANTLSQAGTLTVGAWTHAAFTYDGTTAKIYLNGNTTPDASLTSALAYGTVPANNYIGTLDGTNQRLNGRLAAVGYWSKALSTAEVASLYNSGNGLAFADLSGSLLTSLGSYHDFADPSNLGLDSTANGRNFANTGSVAQVDGPARPHILTRSAVLGSGIY